MTISTDEAFPFVQPPFGAFGSRVVVQIKKPPSKTKGGIILTDDTRDAASDTCLVAKVVRVGPLAFRNRETEKLWPEGAWAEVGDLVAIPLYGGNRRKVKIPGSTESVEFAIMNDLDLLGPIEDEGMQAGYVV